MSANRPEIKHHTMMVEIERNPYEVSFYNSKSKKQSTIVFPIFHFEGIRQYYDLITPVISKGYRVIVINLLTKNDRVLFFNYYFTVFEKILSYLVENEFIEADEKITLMGFGVGGYLVSHMQGTKGFNIDKMILISPFNQFRDQYQIANEIERFKIPTYIHYGQNDEVTSLENRFRIFENGHNNPNVHFSSYPICGHYLYYKHILSLRLEQTYRKNSYDCLIGDSSKYKTSALPKESVVNEQFFTHLFNELNNKENPKRIALLTDVSPLFVNGVAIVMDLLQKELQKLGYEVYMVALWNKKTPLREIPNDTYIPIEASYANFLKGYRELEMLKTLNFIGNAKMLSLFGFDYIHLHTEYSMSQIALKLSKYTGVNILYTYHTLWNLYYEKKFGKLMGDVTYKTAKRLLFNQVYKDCKIITVPSKKSYELLTKDIKNKDIRIIPSPIDESKFVLTRDDAEVISRLKNEYQLRGKKVLGYVGRVSLEKNILETLEHVAKIKPEIPNIVFMVVGVGDAIPALKKAAKEHNLEENVVFVGEIENSKLKYYYSLFDVFVTASNFETQGLTYFEAAQMGTLILAKKDKAIEDVFVDKVNAFIYDGYDQWAERLETALFANNKKIVEEAKKTMKKYSSDKWANQLLGIYQELNPKK